MVSFVFTESAFTLVSIGPVAPRYLTPGDLPEELLALPDRRQIDQPWTTAEVAIAGGEDWELVGRLYDGGFCFGLGRKPAGLQECVPDELLALLDRPSGFEAVDYPVAAGIVPAGTESVSLELTDRTVIVETRVVLDGGFADLFPYRIFTVELLPDESFLAARAQ